MTRGTVVGNLKEKPEAVEISNVWSSSLTSFVDNDDKSRKPASFNVGRSTARRGIFIAAAVLAVAFGGLVALKTVATTRAVHAEFHRQGDLEIERFKALLVGRISEELTHVYRLALLAPPPSSHSSCDVFNEWARVSPGGILQVRAINASGWETIRAEVSDDNSILNGNSSPPVTSSFSCGGRALHNKSGRAYTKVSLQLPASSVYLSEFDLNMDEHDGKIEEPYRPVYRISAPTFTTLNDNETVRTGFLVVNMNATHLWQQISESLAVLGNTLGPAKLSWDLLNTDMHYLASSRLDESALYGHVLPGRSHITYSGPLLSQIQESLSAASDDESPGTRDDATTSVRSGAEVASVIRYSSIFSEITQHLKLVGEGGLVLVLSYSEDEVWRETVSRLTPFFILIPFVYIAVFAFSSMAWAWFQAIKRCEDRNRESHKFLAGMSHDLRSPLHVMSSCLQLLRSEELSQKYEFRALEAAVESMLSLLSNTVYVYRNNKDNHVPPQKTDLRRAVISLLEVTSFLANEKDLNMELNIADSLPETILVNWVGLKQILANLLANGIKFTSRGSISVFIEAEEVPGSSSVSIRISVADTGPGLPGGGGYLISSSSQEASGGLGLAICSRIAESMGATITGTSKPGGTGSVFTLFDLICPVIEAPKPCPIWAKMAAAREASGYDIVAVVSDSDSPSVLPAILAFVERLKGASTVRLSIISGPELADNAAAITPGSIAFIGSHVVRDEKLLSVISKTLRESGSSAILLSFVCGSLSHADATTNLSEEFPCASYAYPPWTPERIAAQVDAQAGKTASVDSSSSGSSSSSFLINDSKKAPAVAAALARSSAGDISSDKDRAWSISPNLRVLVVDDMAVNRKIINRILLRKFKIKAMEASGGFECLDLFREGRGFDLVLMDLNMPGMDGMESTKKLRKLEQELRLAPAVVSGLSALVLDPDRINCLERSGMDTYYSKPMSPEQLGTVLEIAGRRRSSPDCSRPMPPEQLGTTVREKEGRRKSHPV